jgi:hypothetical protein
MYENGKTKLRIFMGEKGEEDLRNAIQERHGEYVSYEVVIDGCCL